MDVYQDGKITGDGSDMPATSCLLTIKQLENGVFEGRFSTSTLANKPTTHLNSNEPQVVYASECPIKEERIIGTQYGAKLMNALQIDESNSQRKWVFNGQIVHTNQIRGSFYGLDCFWGDYTWERVSATPAQDEAASPPIAETPLQSTPKLPRTQLQSTQLQSTQLQSRSAQQEIAAKTVPSKKQIETESNAENNEAVKEMSMAKPLTKQNTLPKKNPITSPTTSPTKSVSPDGVFTHKVVKGETLYSIAHSYNTTVAQLITLNHLAKDKLAIQAGQSLRIR
jgi:LysM repeat protein